MRLITRSVYRAFPELDRYGDAHCVRFVRAARGGPLRQTIFGLIVLLAAATVLAPGIAGTVVLMEAFRGLLDPMNSHVRWGKLVGLVLMLLLIAPAPLVGYLLRDWLLRRRVRWVLRTRGVCSSCTYSLIGLPVAQEKGVAVVRCPECGLECEVDPSLGELAIAADGQALFRPTAEAVTRAYGFWTPRRTRSVRRAFVWTLTGAAAAVVLTAGGYEVFLRVQARSARAARPGLAGYMALVNKHQPVGTAEGEPDAAEALSEALSLMQAQDGWTWRNADLKTAAGNRIHPDWTLLTSPEREEDSWETADKDLRPAREALAWQMLDKYREAGIFDKLRIAARRKRAVRPLALPSGAPLYSTVFDNWYDLVAARACAARSRAAVDAGDRAEFFDALESGLAIARIDRHQLWMIDRLNADAIEQAMLERIAHMLMQRPSAEWVDGVQEVMDRQRSQLGASTIFAGERLMMLDTSAWLFGEAGNVRLGRFSPEVRRLYGGVVNTKLGTFGANEREIEAMYNDADAAAAQERWERTPLPMALTRSRGLAMVDGLHGSFGRALQSMDQIELHRRGVSVMMALERWRLQRGAAGSAYPQTLADLVPEFLDRVPLDPWSGRALCYRSTAEGKSYLLYSVGQDGKDDGGIAAKYRYSALGGVPQKSACDFVINGSGGGE